MLDAGLDQASGLRRLFSRRTLRVLPLAGDGRADGSSGFVANLAAALVRTACRPLVVDAHAGAVCDRLGVAPRFELADLIERGRPFDAVAVRSADGFSVLPAARGLAAMARDPGAGDVLFSAFAALRDGYDVAIVHAPPATLGPLLAGRPVETVLVCGPRDDDLTAAYADLKRMSAGFGLSRFRIVFDRAGTPAQAALRHRRIAALAQSRLGAVVEYGGSVESGDLAFERIASATREWDLAAFEASSSLIH